MNIETILKIEEKYRKGEPMETWEIKYLINMLERRKMA